MSALCSPMTVLNSPFVKSVSGELASFARSSD
jgi:hypothetical protein